MECHLASVKDPEAAAMNFQSNGNFSIVLKELLQAPSRAVSVSKSYRGGINLSLKDHPCFE
jgi:hypothetical protein